MNTVLDYRQKETSKVEEIIAPSHVRHDKNAELQFTTIVQGHKMIRQAYLDTNKHTVIVGQALGNYDVHWTSHALCFDHRNNVPYSPTLTTHLDSQQEKKKLFLVQRGARNYHNIAWTKLSWLKNQRDIHGHNQYVSSLKLKKWQQRQQYASKIKSQNSCTLLVLSLTSATNETFRRTKMSNWLC